MLKTSKTERIELFKDRNTQILLGKFLSGEIRELEPVYDAKTGYQYPIVEAIIGEGESAEKFLDGLHESGVLERKLFDKVIFCPHCGSDNVSVRYCCPYCKSHDIQKSSLIEHVRCGYMDIEENYHHGTTLACPKCGDELKKAEVDYRRAGIWCKCKECQKSFDIPTVSHFCRNCKASSTFEEAMIRSVYSYTLKEEAKEEASLGWILIAPITEFLTKEGFDVQSPAILKGKSGANHTFDVVAHKPYGSKQKTTVIDLAISVGGMVSEQPVIALFAKIFDVSPDEAYLISIPKTSENGRKMAGLYKIKVIEAKDQKQAVDELGARILE